MNITIQRIVDSGILDEERLILEVNHDTDVGRYVVFDTRSSEGGEVSNQLDNAYWFPDRRVSAGDLVILYSKAGKPKMKRNSDGTRSHFFYWGKTHPIWSEPGHFAVLLLVKDWKAKETASR